MEAKWLCDPILLKILTLGRSQSGYIAPTLSACYQRGGIKKATERLTLPGTRKVGKLNWLRVIAFWELQNCRGMKVATSSVNVWLQPSEA